MREANQQAALTTPMTVEKYIQYELTAEHRHEFINGQLFYSALMQSIVLISFLLLAYCLTLPSSPPIHARM